MFRSRFLDRFTRVHPAVPPLLYGPVVALFVVDAARDAGVWVATAFCLLGYGVWTLTEYWLHRAVFHFAPRSRWGSRLHWLVHGVHHDHPNDPRRLVMPPGASVPIAYLFVEAFCRTLGGSHGYATAASSSRAMWCTTCCTSTCTITARTQPWDGGCATVICGITSRTSAVDSA